MIIEDTIWEKIDERLQLWRVREFLSVLRFYAVLLISPRKFYALPSVVTQLQFLQWHELGLADDHANGKAGRCKISQKKHELMAEEYADILGPFNEPDDRTVTRFE